MMEIGALVFARHQTLDVAYSKSITKETILTDRQTDEEQINLINKSVICRTV